MMDMDKETFKLTEAKLYEHYKNISLIKNLEGKVKMLDRELSSIKLEIKNLDDICIVADGNMGIDYSRDMVQTSASNINIAEREMFRYIERKEKQFYKTLEHQDECKAKIIDLKIDNYDIEFNINMLNEEFKRFIKLKYQDRESIINISMQMFEGMERTAYRKREEIINNIAEFMLLTI